MSDHLLPSLKHSYLSLIKQTQPPHLIFAGAGKTTTITAKSAYMVEMEGIDSSRILALTIFREAVRNVRETAEKLL